MSNFSSIEDPPETTQLRIILDLEKGRRRHSNNNARDVLQGLVPTGNCGLCRWFGCIFLLNKKNHVEPISPLMLVMWVH